MKANATQLVTAICKIADCSTLYDVEGPVEAIVELCSLGHLRLPFEPDSIYWVEDKLPVLAEVRKKPERSELLTQLGQMVGTPCLLVDSIENTKGIYLACMTQKWGTVASWVDSMSPERVWFQMQTVQFRGAWEQPTVVILAKLASFVATAT
jgi:hypothetical protein